MTLLSSTLLIVLYTVVMTIKETQILAGKLQGKTSKEIGEIVYPNQLPESAGASVRKVLQKTTIKEALAKALEKHGITIDKALAPIAKGLEATTKHREYITTTIKEGKKTTERKTEVVVTEEDNLPLQLASSDRAVKLLGLEKAHKEPDEPVAPVNNEAIVKAIEAGDMVTLQQVVFNKGI